MKKEFNNPFNLKRNRLIVGLVIGLALSLSFYSLLYLAREVFRLFSVTDTYDLWILSDSEVRFYNLFIAYIAIIIGQSTCMTFWFNRPKSFFAKPNLRNKSIVNDQWNLNSTFIYWFTKLSVIIGLMFGYTFKGGYLTIQFYPKFWYVFVLIILVLFLQSWVSLRLVYKRKSLKWMGKTFLIVSLLAYFISFINLIDYKALNEIYLKKNIRNNYQLNLPYSPCCKHIEKISLIEHIYLVGSKKDTLDEKPVLIVDHKEINLNQLPNQIIQWQSMRGEREIPLMTYQLVIDKRIKMKYVTELKKELIRDSVQRIAYTALSAFDSVTQQFYLNYNFPFMLPPKYNSSIISSQSFTSIKNKIKIEISTDHEILFNSTKTSFNELRNWLTNSISNQSDNIILLDYNPEIDFGSYFEVLSLIKEVIDNLRNEEAMKKYSIPFSELDNDKMYLIKDLYPYRVFEKVLLN